MALFITENNMLQIRILKFRMEIIVLYSPLQAQFLIAGNLEME